MPARILRDWTDSEPVNSLSAQAERHFTRLVMKVDDFGCLTASPRILRALLYPLLLNKIREADLQRWTAECAKAGLIRLYEAEGKQYLEVRKFNQRLRQKIRRHPEPPPDGRLTVGCQSIDGQSTVNGRPEVEGEVEGETEENTHTAGEPPGVRVQGGSHAATPEPATTPPEPAGRGGKSGKSRGAPAGPPGFQRFWSAFPRCERKEGRPQCLKIWGRDGLEDQADRVGAALERAKSTRQWSRDGGAFIPLPATWLGRKPWETSDLDFVVAEPPPPADDSPGFVRAPVTEDLIRLATGRLDPEEGSP